MKIIKKNQLTILVLALMLITAGYLNYTNTVQTSTEVADIGDATLVSSNLSNAISEKQLTENSANAIKEKENSIVIAEEKTAEKNSTQTSEKTKKENENYYITTRLERDTMYSQMLESYQKILDSQTTSTKQKEAAQEEIDEIHKKKNAIMIAENLIRTKGIEDLVILVNDNSISAIVKKEELEKEDIAQIQSIIAREMGAKIEDIHIMRK